LMFDHDCGVHPQKRNMSLCLSVHDQLLHLHLLIALANHQNRVNEFLATVYINRNKGSVHCVKREFND
jgi:hypothetical protein